MILRKHAFTLIEVMLVVTVLSIAAGVVGINIRHAAQEQHFRGEVQLVVDQLAIAQDLMLMAGAEVRVVFEQRDAGIALLLLCDDKLPARWDDLISREIKLTHIHGVHFDSPTEEGKLTLHFLSRGSVMSRGVLRLVGGETRYIALEGFPKAIKAVKEPPVLVEPDLEDLVQLTMEELSEKKTPPDAS